MSATPSPPEITPDMLPVQRLLRWERERRDKIFLSQPVGGGAVQEISWGQAADEVRRMASHLRAQKWPPGSRVAIYGKNSAHWILADLAIWMAGHVSVPIYAAFSAAHLHYVIRHSEARACFVGKLDDTLALLNGLPGYLPIITMVQAPAIASELTDDFALTLPADSFQTASNAWTSIVARTAPMTDGALPNGDSLATVIYTSGTTGDPKGVMQSFNTLAWSVRAATQRVPLSDKDRFLSYLPLAHVAERLLVELGAIHFGAQIFFADNPDTFVHDMQRAQPTVFFSVPRLWTRFQQGVHLKLPARRLNRLLKIPLIGYLVRRQVLKGLGLDQCRLAAGGAAPMPSDLLLWYRALGLDLIEVYGMTENCGASHSTQPGLLPASPELGSVGRPYPGIEQRIDAQNGEIQMRSPGLMLGYYRDPVRTQESLTADGWLRTGDKGEIDSRGCLRITGRVKDIFKTSKGKYVVPSPIEERLLHHPAIEACAVTGANLDQPLALVMLNAEAAEAAGSSTVQRADLETSLAEHLAQVNAGLESHEKLRLLALVTEAWTPENGLVTPTLKVRRGALDAEYGERYAGWAAGDVPLVWVNFGAP